MPRLAQTGHLMTAKIPTEGMVIDIISVIITVDGETIKYLGAVLDKQSILLSKLI